MMVVAVVVWSHVADDPEIVFNEQQVPEVAHADLSPKAAVVQDLVSSFFFRAWLELFGVWAKASG